MVGVVINYTFNQDWKDICGDKYKTIMKKTEKDIQKLKTL
jgi:hypothetical protein